MSHEIVVYEKEFQAAIDAEGGKVLVGLAYKFELIIHGLYRELNSGRIYIRKCDEHRASAPGEAPAVDTAALSKAVTHTDPEKIGDVLSIDLGVTQESGRAEIAEYLEFGTTNIDARPAWRPALEILRQEAEQT
jgi:hypothetical protein